MNLQARSVSYTAGTRHLVCEVDLELAPGELLALAGPNGAGKTTLLRLFSGDLQPTGGAVLLAGKPLHGHGARDLAVRRSVLSQHSGLQFAFTAQEVVAMGRSPHQRHRLHQPRDHDRPSDNEISECAMELTETAHLAQRSFPTLSGGEQRRVSLARVLAQQAPIVLLDEPTASLDIRHQELVMSLARRQADNGAAVLAVLHDLNLAASFADRVAVLSTGRVAALGAPWDVLTEARLSQVFEHPVSVVEHPARRTPLVIPLPTHATRTRQPSARQAT